MIILIYPNYLLTAILVGAALYIKKPDGIIKKAERPECLKESVLARIPIFEE
jgi:predicted metal-binding protein